MQLMSIVDCPIHAIETVLASHIGGDAAGAMTAGGGECEDACLPVVRSEAILSNGAATKFTATAAQAELPARN
jgi:hypothetical protein